MTRTAKGRKPSPAGLKPAGIAGIHQLHRRCQSNLSLSIACPSMCASFIMVDPTSTAIHRLQVTTKASWKVPQARIESRVVGRWNREQQKVRQLTASSAGPSSARLQPFPTPAAVADTSCTGAAEELWGGRSLHPQCSQTTATAPAPLRLQLWRKPAPNTGWKHTRSSARSTSVG